MNGGGAEKVLLTLLSHLSRSKYEITLGLVYRRGPHLASIPSDISVRYLFDDSCSGTTKIIKLDNGALYNQIAPLDSDIEVAFLEGTATKILSKSNNEKSAKFAWVHIDLSKYHYTQMYHIDLESELLCYNSFDKIVFVSEAALNGFESLFGRMLHSKSIVQYNPIDVAQVVNLSTQFPVLKSRLTLCASGRLVPAKGFHLLLAATRMLQEQGVFFDLWILGQGPEYENLLRMSKELKEPCAVRFLGFHMNPYPYMLASDIFVCSSSVEGLSIVMGEALILNKSIISTDCSGARESLQNGIYGVIVQDDERSLAIGIHDAIQRQLNYGTVNMPVSRYAPYDINVQMPKIEDLFDSIFSTRDNS